MNFGANDTFHQWYRLDLVRHRLYPKISLLTNESLIILCLKPNTIIITLTVHFTGVSNPLSTFNTSPYTDSLLSARHNMRRKLSFPRGSFELCTGASATRVAIANIRIDCYLMYHSVLLFSVRLSALSLCSLRHPCLAQPRARYLLSPLNSKRLYARVTHAGRSYFSSPFSSREYRSSRARARADITEDNAQSARYTLTHSSASHFRERLFR